MKSAILVEDEYLAAEELKYLIEKLSELNIVATFDNGLDALEYIQTNQFDVAFLDINIPSINGMLLAKSLQNFKLSPEILFTTAYKEHAAEAFEIEAFDYLLKPYSEERVKKCLKRLTNKLNGSLNTSPASITLYQDARIRLVDIRDIIYAEANGKTTTIHTTHGIFTAPIMLSEFIEKNSTPQFFKAHRSYWVNLDKVEEITPWHSSTYRIKLLGSDKLVPVSRSNIKTFRDRIGL